MFCATQHADIFPNHVLARFVAKDTKSHFIDIENDALDIGNDNGIKGGVEQGFVKGCTVAFQFSRIRAAGTAVGNIVVVRGSARLVARGLLFGLLRIGTVRIETGGSLRCFVSALGLFSNSFDWFRKDQCLM